MISPATAHVVVSTPTGNIGRHLVNDLIAARATPTLFVRDASRIDPAVGAASRVVQGDLLDERRLTEALAGADAFFFCVPTSRAPDARAYYEQYASVAARAVRAARVPAVVFVSSGGKGYPRDAGPMSALHGAEEVLEGSGASIRPLRCGNFMENLLWQVEPLRTRGAFSFPMPPDVAVPTVAAKDIATAACALLLSNPRVDEGAGIYGPEELSNAEMARVLTKALGKKIEFVSVDSTTYRRGLAAHGANAGFIDGMLKMFEAIVDGAYRFDQRNPQLTGSTTLAAWATAHLGARING